MPIPRVDPFADSLAGSAAKRLAARLGISSGGQWFTSPLVYFTDGNRVILVASNYGGARNPGWYHNVKTNPTVTLLGGGFEGRFVGEEAIGEERDRVWALATQWNPGYAHYQSLAGGRTIPLMGFVSID